MNAPALSSVSMRNRGVRVMGLMHQPVGFVRSATFAVLALFSIYVGSWLGWQDVASGPTWEVGGPTWWDAARVTLLFGLPVVLILAFAKLNRVWMVLAAIALGPAMRETLRSYSESESSTAGLVFGLWWIVGAPIALAVVAVTRLTRRS